MYSKKKTSHAPASSVKGKHSYREGTSTVLTEHTNSQMAEVLENEGFAEFVEMLVNKTVEYVVSVFFPIHLKRSNRDILKLLIYYYHYISIVS
jgi:hypothetical protein